MADDLKFNVNRASTGRLGSLSPSGNLDPSQLPAETIQKKAKTDTLRLSGEAAGAAGGVDVGQVRELAQTVGAVQDEKKAVGDLQARIKALVPGINFDTVQGASWGPAELKNLLEVVEAMSPADRQALVGVNFVRAGKIDLAQGADAAVAGQMGQGMGDAAQASAAGVSQIDNPVAHESRFKDYVLKAAEAIEGVPVLRFVGKFLKSLFGKQEPERAIVLGDSGSLISKSVWAHEIGHQVQMANRGWNPERIAEFAKLSGWKEHYGDQTVAADGVDNRTGDKLQFDPNVLKADRQDNFATAYAKTGPVEDFAESYQAFLLDPKGLMQKAPDKFLYLNAQSQRYGASELRGLAQQTGVDLDAVGTELIVASGLKQETLNGIVTVNGLNPDRGALASDAAAQLGGGDALSQAWAKLATAARDPGGAQRIVNDPQGALGEVWNRLGPAEQQVLQDKGFIQARVAELQGGYASTRSASDASKTAISREAVGKLMDGLLRDAGFRAALAQDPTQALKDRGLSEALPPEVVQSFSRNPGAVRKLTETLGKMMENASPEDRQKYEDNLKKALPALGTEHFTAFAAALNNKDEELASKMVKQALETGSVTYQGEGEPPCI